MKHRNCPVCNSPDATTVMRFTPAMIATVNPTYDREKFEEVIYELQDFLTYERCSQCKMIYCSAVWDSRVLQGIYEMTIDHEQSQKKTLSIGKRMLLLREWRNILQILASQGISKIENLKVIDFGCGWGDFLDVIFGYGVESIGHDTDPIKIALPTERGHKTTQSLDELERFSPVDVLVMNSVLEHVLDVHSVLGFVRRALKPNGLFVCSVMDYRSGFIKKNIQRLESGLPPLTKNLNPVEHVNIYNYSSFVATLAGFGFRLITTDSVLTLADRFSLHQNRKAIQLLNKLERFTSTWITGRDLSITTYATHGS